MAKTEQELKELKKKIERLSERLKSLSYEELAQVSGGVTYEGGLNEGFDLDTVYHSEYEFNDVYVEQNPEGIIRNPGDKYFGDR